MENATSSLLERVFSGGPESVIALLLLVIIGIGYIVRLILQREDERDKVQVTRISDLEKRLDDMTKSYHDKLESLLDRYHDNNKTYLEALNRVNETLTKIMVKLFG